jgi:hypothetical protein
VPAWPDAAFLSPECHIQIKEGATSSMITS